MLMTLRTARAMTSVSRRRRNLLLGEIWGRLASGLVAVLPWLIAYQPFSRLPKKKPTVAAARACRGESAAITATNRAWSIQSTTTARTR